MNKKISTYVYVGTYICIIVILNNFGVLGWGGEVGREDTKYQRGGTAGIRECDLR